MTKSKTPIIIGVVIIVILSSYFFVRGNKITGVFLEDYQLINNKTMVLKMSVSSSYGYIRTIKEKRENNKIYLTFYDTFGINSSIGVKEKFEIKIDDNITDIYFYTGKKEYKKVLEKNSDSEWIRVKNV